MRSCTRRVDPELLEIAWEVCAEQPANGRSPQQILSLIDEKLCKTPIDQYRAFRLLSSDLGKIFFKALSGNAFKPKSSSSVRASKDLWCHQPTHTTLEYCFV